MRFLTLIAAIVATILAARGEVADSVVARFDERQLLDIEGVWQWTSGATVAITADSRGGVQLVLIDTPDPLTATPQPMGQGSFGGRDGSYNLKLHSAIDPATGFFTTATNNFVARVDKDGCLTLTPYSTRWHINARRLLPYLFRISINRDNQPDGLEGARRIYPRLGTSTFPVVL